MKLWVDAQLPPALAAWLSEKYAVEALSLRDLGMRDATDAEIFEAARQAGAVIISKDSDFVDLVSRHGIPPQLLWVTCGNVTNTSANGIRQDIRRGPGNAVGRTAHRRDRMTRVDGCATCDSRAAA